jgi:hypothetical protein
MSTNKFGLNIEKVRQIFGQTLHNKGDHEVPEERIQGLHYLSHTDEKNGKGRGAEKVTDLHSLKEFYMSFLLMSLGWVQSPSDHKHRHIDTRSTREVQGVL